jgi:REP-associated tyrosine transposase
MIPKNKTIKHYHVPGHAHYLTFSCFHGLPLLEIEEMKLRLAQSINKSGEKYHFDLIAYVFMPNHVHLLVFPRLKSYDISSFLKSVKQPVSRYARKWLGIHNPSLKRAVTVFEKERSIFHFWQKGPGYDRNLHSEEATHKTIKYIHNNPIRRGLVESSMDWEWSSLKWYMKEEEGPVKISPLPR